jgi:CheY-like chemotaxis protein
VFHSTAGSLGSGASSHPRGGRPATPARRGWQRSSVKGHAPLVLLVDDSASARDLYRQYLRFVGYDVEVAQNGEEALERAAQLIPDIIIMDLMMPGLDGLEATRALKRAPSLRHIPIVALTAYGTYFPTEWALSAGCDAYLSKPCLPQDLEEVILRFLGRGQG